MNCIRKAVIFPTLAAILLSGGIALSQDHHDDYRHDDHHDNHAYVHHEEWKHGYHMRHEDWDRGERIDYHRYHLQEPPRGYEWREVDGNYVLAAVATGVIASVIVASEVH
jgi:Ni/Co efflux regulator RcnB